MSVENVKKTIVIINQHQEDADFEGIQEALLHKDLIIKVPLSYSNLRDNLGMRSA